MNQMHGLQSAEKNTVKHNITLLSATNILDLFLPSELP